MCFVKYKLTHSQYINQLPRGELKFGKIFEYKTTNVLPPKTLQSTSIAPWGPKLTNAADMIIMHKAG